MALLLLNEDEIRQTVNLSEAIAVIEAAFAASAENQIKSPGSFNLDFPEVDGSVEVKATYLQNAPYYVIKVGNQFTNNPQINLPANSGMITLFDAATGFPAAVLLDNSYLTNVRTGVVGALATQYLANNEAGEIAVIGSDQQAFLLLKSLIAVRTVKRVTVWGNTPLDADVYARRMVEDHDVNIEIAPSTEAAVAAAEIVLLTEPHLSPPIQAGWLRPGTHITALGNPGGNLPVLDSRLLDRVDMIVADRPSPALNAGTGHQAQGELSQLIRGKIPGRTRTDQITLARLQGLDWQDAVIATLALDKALFLGLGQRIEFGLPQRHPVYGAQRLQ